MNQPLIDDIKHLYIEQFGLDCETKYIFSPGRINLIGEHTDYNNGLVLPAAISQGIYLAVGRAAKSSTIVSIDLRDTHSFSIKDSIAPMKNGGWKNYVMGVIHQLKEADHQLEEVNIVFAGDIPIGGGLSSSAALENAVGYGLNELYGLDLDKLALIKHSRKAEHDFAGVKCGIMDQFASMMGAKNTAILLDCESLNYSEVPIVLDGYSLVLCNSNVKHNLVNSEYNVRRTECEAGVRVLQKYYPEVKSLRDVSSDMLAKHKTVLDPIVLKRCEYIIEENQRVRAFALAIKKQDFIAAGTILYEAHAGMRYKYEITCSEIDFMVDFASAYEAVIGSRMMGGGFGGCTINIVRNSAKELFKKDISRAYESRFGIGVSDIDVKLGNGTQVISD